MNKFPSSATNQIVRRRKPNVDKEGDEALFNYALHLAQEWGIDWLSPIQERLEQDFPDLDSRNLDYLNELAREAMHYGYDLFRDLSEPKVGERLEAEWRTKCLSKYGWIDDNNLERLFSTGMYYSLK